MTFNEIHNTFYTKVDLRKMFIMTMMINHIRSKCIKEKRVVTPINNGKKQTENCKQNNSDLGDTVSNKDKKEETYSDCINDRKMKTVYGRSGFYPSSLNKHLNIETDNKNKRSISPGIRQIKSYKAINHSQSSQLKKNFKIIKEDSSVNYVNEAGPSGKF